MDCDKFITDSGGVSKESFFAGKPCIIPMENSWWADIVEAGWAVETGADYERLGEAIESHVPPDDVPPSLFGDGSSAVNIARELEAEFEPKASDGPWHPHGYTHTFPKQGDRGGRFTYSEYLKLLDGFRESGYRFSAFPETQALLETNSSFVLLRHDIDMSLEAALRLAELEARIGVIATYFFLVRTDHYNVFSRTGSQIVNRIVGLGHHLGSHFDCGSLRRTVRRSITAGLLGRSQPA